MCRSIISSITHSAKETRQQKYKWRWWLEAIGKGWESWTKFEKRGGGGGGGGGGAGNIGQRVFIK